MLLVVIIYLFIKNKLSSRRVDPLARGTYETIFTNFAEEHPHLWSRNGPRDYVRAKGVFSRIKWALVSRWFAPSRTTTSRPIADINDMGIWARIKHDLARRWLGQIQIHPEDESNAELGTAGAEFGAVMELVGVATPVAMADGDPRAAAEMANSPLRRKLLGRKRASSASSSGSRGRGGFSSSVHRIASPSGSEGMVEEEQGEFSGREDMDDYDEWEQGRIAEEERAERRRQRVEHPTTEGPSTLLAIPQTSRQVLTRSPSR